MATNTSTTPAGIEQARAYIESLEANNFDWGMLVGDAFVRGMRDIGYKSTAFAVSELVDNSIQAGATWIDIAFGFDRGKKPARLAVIDDAHGMEPMMTRASLVWGAGTRGENTSGMGKYGYGLPSASVSQCRRVTVFSRTSETGWHSSYLDIDEIKNGAWNENDRIQFPEPIAGEPPQWVIDHLKQRNKWNDFTHGTVVVWDQLDRVEKKTRDAFKAHLVTDLGVIYRNYLSSTPMWIDGTDVEPCDPLFVTEGYRYFDLDEDRAISYPSATVVVKDKARGELGKMTVRFARMPATFFRIPEKKHTNKPGRDGTNSRLEIADTNNGIIFLRDGRQIDVLRPPRRLANINATTDRFWSVEVDFEPALDDFFSITTSKQQVRPEDKIWDVLADQANLFTNIGQMRTEYKKDASTVAGRAETDKAGKRPSVEAIEAAEKYKTTPKPKDTKERREEAQKNLEQTAQREARRSGKEAEEVEQDLLASQEGRPLDVQIEDVPGGAMYRCVQMGGQRVLFLNSAHPFYVDLYNAPATTPWMRAGLEILLWALGEAEVDADPNSDRRTFYERDRVSVWSPYIADALKALDTIDTVKDNEVED